MTKAANIVCSWIYKGEFPRDGSPDSNGGLLDRTDTMSIGSDFASKFSASRSRQRYGTEQIISGALGNRNSNSPIHIQHRPSIDKDGIPRQVIKLEKEYLKKRLMRNKNTFSTIDGC